MSVELGGGDTYRCGPRLFHTHVLGVGGARPEAGDTIANLKVINDRAFRALRNNLGYADRVRACQLLKLVAGGDLTGQRFEPFKTEISNHAHSLADVLTKADELRHPTSAVESWWWWGRSAAGDCGVYVGFELRAQRFDYRAGLVRAGEPYLYIEELDGSGLRRGLEIKPPEMWADHLCDVPFQQWSVANEAHAVLLDDPLDALRRPYGTPTPATFDIEWFSSEEVSLTPGGYEQAGEVDARIELSDGVVSISGPGHRLHVWGTAYRPSPVAIAAGETQLLAPYRCHDATGVTQVLTDRGWQVTEVVGH